MSMDFPPGLICYRLVLPLLHRGRPLQIPPSSPNKKGPHPNGCGPFMAEKEGFELLVPCPILTFPECFLHLFISSRLKKTYKSTKQFFSHRDKGKNKGKFFRIAGIGIAIYLFYDNISLYKLNSIFINNMLKTADPP